MKQSIYDNADIVGVLDRIASEKGMTNAKWFVVCGNTCSKFELSTKLRDSDIETVWFSDFAPNPDYESVVNGIRLFNAENCTGIVAIGGGSGMDVAKCIKLYAKMDYESNLLQQEVISNDIPILAVPTTAGTGSEATRYAVIYYNGVKQSITSEDIIPEYVIFDPKLLETLPEYQKKATMLDALCHAVESMWSVNSTEESRNYSEQAITLILENMEDYLRNDEKALRNMLMAGNIAGKAINITQTTAGHAMCYKITSLYKIAHGHAAALCVRKLWPYMVEHISDVSDVRGENHLNGIFERLAKAFGQNNLEDGAKAFERLFTNLHLEIPKIQDAEQLEKLTQSVNLTRLKNNPIKLSKEDLRNLYTEILE